MPLPLHKVEGMQDDELQATSDVFIEMFDRQAAAMRARHQDEPLDRKEPGLKALGPMARHGISPEQLQQWGEEEMAKRGKKSQQAGSRPKSPPHSPPSAHKGSLADSREELVLALRHARAMLVQVLRANLIKDQLTRAVRQWEARALIAAFSLECERSELELYDERRRLDAAKAINVGLRRLAEHSGGNIAELESGIDSAAGLAANLHGELKLTQGELEEARLSLSEMGNLKGEVEELQGALNHAVQNALVIGRASASLHSRQWQLARLIYAWRLKIVYRSGEKARRLQILAKCGLRQAQQEIECCRIQRCTEVWIRQLFSENEENLTYNIEVLLAAAKESEAIIAGNKVQEEFSIKVRQEQLATVEAQALRLGLTFGWWAATVATKRLQARVQAVPNAYNELHLDLDQTSDRRHDGQSYQSEAYNEMSDDTGEAMESSRGSEAQSRDGTPPRESSARSRVSSESRGPSTTRSFHDEAQKRLSKVRWTTRIPAQNNEVHAGDKEGGPPQAAGNIQSSIARMIKARNSYSHR